MLANILIALLLGANAAPAPTSVEDPAERRLRFLASSLDTPVNVKEKENTLSLLLTDLAEQASGADKDKDPAHKVTFVLHLGFAQEAAGKFEPEVFQIKFATPLQGIPLRTALELICDQLPGKGGIMLRRGFIELVPSNVLAAELSIDLISNLLVARIYEKTTLAAAFKELGEKYNQNIVICPQAEKALSQEITARLVNVPFGTAVETLADMAELRVLRRPNIWLVTTQEHYAALIGDDQKRPNPDKKRDEEPKVKPGPPK